MSEEKKEPLEIWSCDPKSIKPWTKEAEERLHKALDKIFGTPAEKAQENK